MPISQPFRTALPAADAPEHDGILAELTTHFTPNGIFECRR